MSEVIKTWITSIFCLGILIALLQLMIPKNNLKKNIYSLISIVMIITILYPVINVYNNNSLDESIKEVISAFSSSDNISTDVDSEEVNKIKEQLVKEQFLDSLKKDIQTKLLLKNIDVENIYIDMDDDYNINKINITIGNLGNKENNLILSVNKIVEYINSEYDIDYSKITVTEEGG